MGVRLTHHPEHHFLPPLLPGLGPPPADVPHSPRPPGPALPCPAQVSGHPFGWGCLVSGPGSSLEADGCTIRDNALNGVKVANGGSASLMSCQQTGNNYDGALQLQL